MDFNLEEIIDLDWEQEERTVIERIVKHFKSWKRYIPSKIENDIVYIIKLAIKEKRKIIELESKNTRERNQINFNLPIQDDHSFETIDKMIRSHLQLKHMSEYNIYN